MEKCSECGKKLKRDEFEMCDKCIEKLEDRENDDED